MQQCRNHNIFKTVAAFVFTVLLLIPTSLRFAHAVEHNHYFAHTEAGIHNQQDKCLINEFEFAAFVEPASIFEIAIRIEVAELYYPIIEAFISSDFIYSGSPRSPPYCL